MNSRYIYVAYRKARRRFSLKAYLLLLVWLAIALIQWSVVCYIEEVNDIFRKHYYISLATFALAIVLFLLFLFIEDLRFHPIVSPIVSFIIVELQIVSLFTLVSRTYWAEMLMYFGICAVLICIFAIIGACLPRRMDLTLHIALLFILAFIFLLVAVFFLIHQLLVVEYWREVHDYGYLLVQVPVTLTILFFVMYHAQTIHGGRFAEMRLHDYCLGSLILFHDFLIIYWLTFYWQLVSGVVSPTSWTLLTTSWARSDKRHFDENFDDDSDNVISLNIYRDGVTKIIKAKTTESEFVITQDFLETKSTDALIAHNWQSKWIARDPYRFGRKEEQASRSYNDGNS